MQLFYSPEVSEAPFLLPEEEAIHAVKSLRLQKGDDIFLTDGKGNLFRCGIVDASKKKCEVQVLEKLPDKQERKVFLQIAIAPTKNINRYEWFLEKATEIGIDKISPVFCKHSERKVIKAERLNKILVAAMKQSQRTVLPELQKAVNFDDFIQTRFDGKKFIAYCDENNRHLKHLYNQGENALVLIGPEGDFTDDEIKTAIDAGFEAVSLGESRLRTETAGVVTCAAIDLMNV